MTRTGLTRSDEACCFVFLVETGESRTPRLDLSRVHFRYDLFYVHEKLVGVARFELTTPRSQSGCATTAPHPDRQILLSCGID